METMQRLQAYKYELMPTGNQQRDMRRFAGACRFVYNKALALQPTTKQGASSFAMWRWRTYFQHGKASLPGSRNLLPKPFNTPSRIWIAPSSTSSRSEQPTLDSRSVG